MHYLFTILLLLLFATDTIQAKPLSNSDFAVAEGSGMQNRPAITYDKNGDQFFLTWFDFRNRKTTGLDIYGRIVDANGLPITGDIPVARVKGSQSFPAVAFDTVNNRYLVVWSDWRDATDVDSDIYGRMINADGNPHGDEFPIASLRGVSQKISSLAFDPVRQRYLVLWIDSRNNFVDKTYGRFVDAEGGLVGDDFAIALEGNSQDSPSVLFDTRKDQFLVAWRDTKNLENFQIEKAVYGSFVDAVDGPSGTAFQIALEKTGCTPLSLKAISYSPTEDFYFVAWSSGRNYHEVMPLTERQDYRPGYDDRPLGLDVYGAFIDINDGSIRKEPFKIASKIDYQEMPSVEYDSLHKRFLVVWYDLRRPPTNRNNDIYGRYVMLEGTMSKEFLISDELAMGSRQLPTVAFSSRSDNFLILWEDGRQGGGQKTKVYARVYKD